MMSGISHRDKKNAILKELTFFADKKKREKEARLTSIKKMDTNLKPPADQIR